MPSLEVNFTKATAAQIAAEPLAAGWTRFAPAWEEAARTGSGDALAAIIQELMLSHQLPVPFGVGVLAASIGYDPDTPGASTSGEPLPDEAVEAALQAIPAPAEAYLFRTQRAKFDAWVREGRAMWRFFYSSQRG